MSNITLNGNWQNVASHQISLSSGFKCTFYIDAYIGSQDTSNNKTPVYTRLTSVVNSGSCAGSGFKFELTGAAAYEGGSVWTFENETILSGGFWQNHNDDGTAEIGLSAHVYNKYHGIDFWFSTSGSGNRIFLPTIPRASQPSINTWPQNTPNFNLEDEITIHMNRKSSDFLHEVYFIYNNVEYLVGDGIRDNVTFDTSLIADNIYELIPNEKYYENNIKVRTYKLVNGSKSYISSAKTCAYKANVVNANPTFNHAYQDINPTTVAITGDNTKIIRNNSHLQIYVTNTDSKKGSSLSSLKAIIDGVEYEGSLRGTGGSIETGTLNLSSDTTAEVILTDSRGFSTTHSVTINILDWVIPNGIIILARHDNFYSQTDITVDANYSSLDSLNQISIKVRYKKTSEQSYSNYVILSDNITSVLTLDNDYSWDIQVLIEDLIGSMTYNLTLARGIPLVFYSKNKSSVGVNCFPKYSNSLEVNGVDISNTYSTDERPIGTWIDGKIIYRKVISIGAVDSGNISVDHDITNLGTVINIYGMGINTYNNNTTQYPIPKVSNSSADNQMGVQVSSSQITILKGNTTTFNEDSFVVIEYTKSN